MQCHDHRRRDRIQAHSPNRRRTQGQESRKRKSRRHRLPPPAISSSTSPPTHSWTRPPLCRMPMRKPHAPRAAHTGENARRGDAQRSRSRWSTPLCSTVTPSLSASLEAGAANAVLLLPLVSPLFSFGSFLYPDLPLRLHSPGHG